ncbi:hypothetical protein AKJ09_03142 [Labilithrix luteola]|uniref:Uncharacterized protein n=1 Tax=Labilithrix luteola TaxID=1391654 RepID=A0A0K1PSG6_9BACT|nr:hypothetical protein AKJ09_03142 [Labilithrix luteola]
MPNSFTAPRSRASNRRFRETKTPVARHKASAGSFVALMYPVTSRETKTPLGRGEASGGFFVALM